MPAALCPAGEFPATTTLPRYAAGREDMVAVLLLFCGQAGQFLELTNNANRSSTRLLQDYFGWHGMLVDEANYGQIVRRAPCADGKCTTLASLSKQLPNSRINLMAIDATRDASPLPLLQTIDWSIKIDALVIKSRALSTSIAGAPVAAVARRAGLVALTARDHAWVGFPGVRWFVSPDVKARIAAASTARPGQVLARPHFTRRLHDVSRASADKLPIGDLGCTPCAEMWRSPKHSQLPADSLSYVGGSRVRVDPVLGLPPTKKPAALKMTREKRLKKRAERRGKLYAKAEAAEAYQHATTPPALEAANKIS